MDLGDHGLGQGDDRLHEAAALGEQCFVGLASCVGANFLEVVPSAKGGSGAPEDHDTRIALGDIVQSVL